MSKENAEINEKADTEHFDVLIIGAGISGVAAGVYLEKHCPSENFLILKLKKAMEEPGGHIVPLAFVPIVTCTRLDIVLNPGLGRRLPRRMRYSLIWGKL